jgi:hypothetical protein
MNSQYVFWKTLTTLRKISLVPELTNGVLNINMRK